MRGLYHGQGTLDNADQGRYSGMWRLGLKHGAGRTEFADGGVFVGIYNDNVYKRGKLRNGNGDEYEGTFDAHGTLSQVAPPRLRSAQLTRLFWCGAWPR